jgi:hypothetical protein
LWPGTEYQNQSDIQTIENGQIMNQMIKIIGCDRFAIKSDNKSRATVGMNGRQQVVVMMNS